MIEATQKKLREASFFLGRLEQALSDSEISSAETVDFYLSAFLSAARSVTFVLEAEAGSKYIEWSPAWRESRSESERRLLAKFTEARNRAVKRESPKTSQKHDELPAQSSTGLPIGVAMFIFDDYDFQVADRSFSFQLTPKDVEQEIFPLCREYSLLLSELVADFIKSYAV